ncbi:MAG: PfaD family polyunsaturated fatty acid/polyketide biosynthesis protein, partial [Steroidobacteraceae bacterium]
MSDFEFPIPLRFASAEELGSAHFRADYRTRYAYAAGAMYKAIASPRLVVRMAKSRMLSFLGTGGQSLEEIEKALAFIQRECDDDLPYGANLLHHPGNPQLELRTVDLYLRCGVRNVEASAFMGITPALVLYRLRGLRAAPNGAVVSDHRIVAKVSRPEIAEAFLSPAPMALVGKLAEEGRITEQQAGLSRHIGMCDDVCAEADSGGHTDGAVSIALVPTIARLRDAVARSHGYARRIRVGAAGGIGTPEAVAAVLLLGAQFVVTGSINQCTVEAGTSDCVKDMLQEMNIQDTDYAPAGDMFELGAKVQVLKRGVLFPTRASRLHELWRQYDRWEDIDAKLRRQIEEKFFMRSFEAV